MCNRCDPRCARSVPITPAITTAANLIRALYECTGAGGAAHIVTDDFNIDDHWVEHCIASAKVLLPHGETLQAPDESIAALEALRPLTRLERVKAIHLAEREAAKPHAWQR